MPTKASQAFNSVHGNPNRRVKLEISGGADREAAEERGWWWRKWQKYEKVVKTEVEGGPHGCRGGDDQNKKTDFGGECWSCGGCHRSDRCDSEGRWRRQLANAVRRLVQVGKGDQWIAREVARGSRCVGECEEVKAAGASCRLSRGRGE